MGFISFELMHLLKKMLCACFLFMAVIPMAAQEGDAQDAENTSSWYIGLQGGVPFGTSTFSSFGADKTRAGFDAGLYGGYRFNPVLSLEAQAAWGRVNQSVQECCAPYWLGSDLHRYEAPVAGLEGWSYADLKSRVATQRYGLQLNMNLLGFFARTKDSRWSLDISPALSAIGTDSSIRTIAGGNEAVKGNTRWHFGAGGNVQAGYMLTRNLHIGIYSGITYLTGDAMDGLPEYRHKNNFIWESGLKFGWTFGKKGKPARQTGVSACIPAKEEALTVQNDAEPETDAPAGRAIPERAKAEETAIASVATEAAEAAEVSFPVIYFPFNGTEVTVSELPKARRILGILNAHPGMKVVVIGWCDTKGSQEVNERYSLRRAETVKNWLVEQGIRADHIRTVGKGSDSHAADANAARRVETKEQGKEDSIQ